MAFWSALESRKKQWTFAKGHVGGGPSCKILAVNILVTAGAPLTACEKDARFTDVWLKYLL